MEDFADFSTTSHTARMRRVKALAKRVFSLQIALLLASAACASIGAVALQSYLNDRNFLEGVATTVAGQESTPARQISELNRWVYRNKGFKKNAEYFWFRRLGATPRQILATGGDCADKSRLLSSMLSSLGYRSGLVMMFPCDHCSPVHTLVEAEYGEGRRMIVDPIWDIDYPAAGGDYYGLDDLRNNSVAKLRRSVVTQERGEGSKISLMPDTEVNFDYATGINWDANPVFRILARSLSFAGEQPRNIMRPRILEEPELLVSTTFFGLAFLLLSGYLWLNRRRALAASPEIQHPDKCIFYERCIWSPMHLVRTSEFQLD